MSHYFSRITLEPNAMYDPWFHDLLKKGDTYRDHALIWRLFPGDGGMRDFLFRRHEDGRQYWLVSARQPRAVAGLMAVRSKPYDPALEPGDRVQFDLRANPVVSHRREGKKSRRHDILMDARHRLGDKLTGAHLEEAGRNWLLQRAQSWGLMVDEPTLSQHSYCQHNLNSKGREIRYSSLDYQGVATVTDPHCLRRALLEGVGHAKGFGCGLLLLKKLH